MERFARYRSSTGKALLPALTGAPLGVRCLG